MMRKELDAEDHPAAFKKQSYQLSIQICRWENHTLVRHRH